MDKQCADKLGACAFVCVVCVAQWKVTCSQRLGCVCVCVYLTYPHKTWSFALLC